ncbi:MAG: extracellular solute-binding protein [Dongiaceae bacterium]
MHNAMAGRVQPRRIGRRTVLQLLGSTGLAFVSIPVINGRALAADDLLVFDWAGYDVPELHQDYIKKYGASPTIALFGDDEEAYLKVSGGYEVDLVHPTSYAIARYRDGGLLKPIDTSRLSNWPDVMPQLANRPGMSTDGNQWLVPCGWGYNSVLYRSDLVEIEEESWSLLFDERYKGRLSVAGEMDGTVIPAAMTLGIADPFNMSDDELAQVADLLRKQRALNRFYWTDPTEIEQAIASGEVVAAYTWAASASTLKSQGIPVKYMTPKEGVLGWIDGFIMLKDGPGIEQNAYDYIDAWLAPETGQWMIENYGYAHSNEKSFGMVSQERLDEIGIPSTDEVLSKGVFLQEMDPQVRQKYVEMFEAVKAGQ